MLKNVHSNIIDHLKKDPKLAEVINACSLDLIKEPRDVFTDLLRSIVSQQLSTSAAATIYGRFINSLDEKLPIGDQILDKTIDELRLCGLSGQKANYIKNVVLHFDENNLYSTDWDKWSDDEIVVELSKIKGVGKWTVEMILMFSLHREDVLPLDDLIIKNNMVKMYDVKSEKKQLIVDLIEIAEKWRPYRSYACFYLWAAKNTNLFK